MAPINLLQSLNNSVQQFRKKIVLLLGILLAGSVIGYLNAQSVITYLDNISEKVTIIQKAPAEGFTTMIKIALIIGMVLTVPFIFQILIDFMKKRFPRLGIKNSYLVTALCYGLFMVGAVFAFLIIVPFAIQFLAEYGGDAVHNTYTFNSYVSFLTILIFVFGFAFELPVVVIALSYARVIKSKSLVKNRKFVILGIVLGVAFVTPPDVFTLIVLAVPLIVLYEISILFAKARDRSLDRATRVTVAPTGEMVIPKGYEEASKIKTKEALEEAGLTVEQMEEMSKRMLKALGHGDPEPEPEPESYTESEPEPKTEPESETESDKTE